MRKVDSLMESYRGVLKLLQLQQRVWSEAGASGEMLDAYSAVLRYLNRLPDSEIDKIIADARKTGQAHKWRRSLTPDTSSFSLDEIERLIADETTPRKLLEAIAVQRFQVPKGSLRSFANTQILREKIITLAQNERAHETISSVARHTKS